jgi:hypothetical protein
MQNAIAKLELSVRSIGNPQRWMEILDGFSFNGMMVYSVLLIEGESIEQRTAGFCK